MKEPTWKGYILSDFNYMTTWKSQNYRDRKEISGYGKEDEQAEHRGFRAGKQLCATSMLLYICLTHRMYTKMEPWWEISTLDGGVQIEVHQL